MPKKTVSQAEQEYQSRLGPLIVALRGIVGMSQATLAERVERSEAALSRWEGGKATPSAFDVRKVADTITDEMRKRTDLDLPQTLDLASLLLYPPAVYTNPLIIAVFDRIQSHLAETARQPRPDVVPTTAEAGLALRVNPRAIVEGGRRGQTHEPEVPAKPPQSRQRPVRAK